MDGHVTRAIGADVPMHDDDVRRAQQLVEVFVDEAGCRRHRCAPSRADAPSDRADVETVGRLVGEDDAWLSA